MWSQQIAVSFVICLLAIQGAKCHVDNAKVEKSIQACAKDAKFTPDELKIVSNDQMFTATNITPAIKCFVACYYKAMGLVDDKGMHKPIPTVHYFEDLYKESKLKVPNAVTKCNAASKDLPYCDAVYNFENCIRQELK